MRMPVIFSGHGSPMVALEDNEITHGMQKVGEETIRKTYDMNYVDSYSKQAIAINLSDISTKFPNGATDRNTHGPAARGPNNLN